MKEFDLWNTLKKKINEKEEDIYISDREIRFCHYGANIGHEQDGKGQYFLRPVLVLKRIGSMYRVAPMTTTSPDGKFVFTLPEHYFSSTSRVILSQVKVIDRKRLTQKIGILHPNDFIRIQERLRTLLF